jgi:predicted DNA-binding antitoxin AbrB/MazE fold protein
MLKPVEPLDLPDGSEVDVTVEAGPSEADVAAFRSAAGAWRGTMDADKFIRNVYEDRSLHTRPVPHL